MEVDGFSYVAKRLRKNCVNVESFVKNKSYLRSNIGLQFLTSKALEAFYENADNLGIEAEVHSGNSERSCQYTAFEVQPSFLAVEDLEEASPSVASGVPAEVLQTAQAEYDAAAPGVFSESTRPQIFWLIQRYNRKAQDRWNLMKPTVTPSTVGWFLFKPQRTPTIGMVQTSL